MRNLKEFIQISFFILIVNPCLAQSTDFAYVNIDRKSDFIEIDTTTFRLLLDYLPENYVTNATQDYTEFIQRAVDENKNVVFPDFPLLINDEGVKLRNNTCIFFQVNSSLIMKSSKKAKFSFFYLSNVDNVKIYNASLVGDRYRHLNEDGEWGMGISIYGSTNVKLYNIRLNEMWGDGVYINSSKDKESSDVLINGGYIDDSRRNGISIISGRNITIDDLLISNTNGRRPGSGIDIEPNNRSNILENIVLKDIKTFNNQNEGILLVLTRIGNDTFSKKISVYIKNHVDIHSNYAMRFGSGFRKSDLGLSGIIRVENSRWIDFRNEGILKIAGNLNKLPRISFEKISVIKDDKEINFSKHIRDIQKGNKVFFIK